MSEEDNVSGGDRPLKGEGPSRQPVACNIEGRWACLRPLDPESDARRIFELSHGELVEDTWKEMKVGPFPDLATFQEHATSLVKDEKRWFFAVTGPDDNALGWMCLMEARIPHGVVEIGYVLYPPVLQRTALATDAFYLMMKHVFEELNFRRLEWTCTAQNSRSRIAAERLGFVYEGTHREGLVLKGRARDVCMYSMLASEWPDTRDALQAWLAPENFVDDRRLRSLVSFREDQGHHRQETS